MEDNVHPETGRMRVETAENAIEALCHSLIETLQADELSAFKGQLTTLAAAMVITSVRQIAAHRENLGHCRIKCNSTQRGGLFELDINIAIPFLTGSSVRPNDQEALASQPVTHVKPRRRYTYTPGARERKAERLREYWAQRRADQTAMATSSKIAQERLSAEPDDEPSVTPGEGQ